MNPKCPICEEEFETEEELAEHVKTAHPETSERVPADLPNDGMTETREHTDQMMEEGEKEGTPLA